MKKVLQLSLMGMVALLFSGCMASMNSHALDLSNKLPADEGYVTYSKVVKMDERDVNAVLRKTKSILLGLDKTERSRNYSQAAKKLYANAQKLYNTPVPANWGLAQYAQMKVLASAVVIEPSELTDVQDTLSDHSYKKVAVELQEYDVVNGCQNGVKKLFSGFAKRYLYYGAVKENDGWRFYLKIPKLEVQYPGAGDGNKCSSFYNGPEAHALMLSVIIRSQWDHMLTKS